MRRISSCKKDSMNWNECNEPITNAQIAYLKVLSHQTGEIFDIDEKLTKAEASAKIEKLKEKISSK